MGLFTNWFKKKEPAQETRGLFCDSLMYNMNGGYTTNKAMLLIVLFTDAWMLLVTQWHNYH